MVRNLGFVQRVREALKLSTLAGEVTRSDLHFGKVSLSWEGGWMAECRLMA